MTGTRYLTYNKDRDTKPRAFSGLYFLTMTEPQTIEPKVLSAKGQRGADLLRKINAGRKNPMNKKKEPNHVSLLEESDSPLAALVYELKMKYNLNNHMVDFLIMRPKFPSDRDTCRFLGFSPSIAGTWKFTNGGSYAKNDFKSAYDEFMSRQKEMASKHVESMAMKIVGRIDNLLDATKKIYDADGNLLHEDPDYQAQFKGIEAGSRWLGKGWNEGSDNSADPRYISVMDRFNQFAEKLLEEKRREIVIDQPKELK